MKHALWKRSLLLGILIAGLLFFLLLPLPRVQALLFSPGKGVHNERAACISCHSPFSSKTDCSNIACHPNLPSTYKNSTVYQFHFLVSQKESCTACHTEHADPVDGYASRQFNHAFFTVSQSAQCQSCHTVPKDTIHQKIAGTTGCQSCHSETSWKGAKFSHDVLTVQQRSQCLSCHTAPADQQHKLFSQQCFQCHSVSSWRDVRFSHQALSDQGRLSCGICHQAPRNEEHIGVGIDCSKCHTTEGWGDD